MSTPMLDQYYRLCQEAGDAILFYRLGDFYEIFGQDAERVAPLLDVQLTSRDGKIAMCGVPHHALMAYAQRLLDRGFKVAIAEQMQDPRATKGLVDRQITQTLTPGTFIPEASDRVPRFAVLYQAPDGWALVVAEMSTGIIHVMDIDGRGSDQLLEEWERWAPHEYLSNHRGDLPLSGLAVEPAQWFRIRNPLEDEQELARHLGATTLDSWALSSSPRARIGLLVLWRYLRASQHRNPHHLTQLRIHSQKDTMRISARTMRQLEVVQSSTKSLFDYLNHTVTPMGHRLLHDWVQRPLTRMERITQRHRAVQWLLEHPDLNESLRHCLKGMGDLTRRTARLTMGSGLPRDLAGIVAALAQVPALNHLLAMDHWWPGSLPNDKVLLELGDVLRVVSEPPPARWDDDGLIRSGIDETLDAARTLRDHQREALTELEAAERARLGLKSLKVGYHRSFGYYWDVSRGQARSVPSDWQRRQTMTNSERFTSSSLQELEQRIKEAEETIAACQSQWAHSLIEAVTQHARELGQLAEQVALADVLTSLAQVAQSDRLTSPRWVLDDEQVHITAKALRHPVLASVIDDYVPSDVYLGPDHRLAVLTGPNMGGKSTYMRALAANVIMAHIGGLVSASECTFPIIDGLFTRIGADDDMFRGQSTFMVEMEEVASILKQATPSSLVLLDELGRGTSTYDGLAIARAVAERLAGPGAPWTIFATHYHELGELADELPRAFNLTAEVVEADSGRLVFTHRVVQGQASRSYGLDVAKMAGLPHTVLVRARHYLKHWEPNRLPNPKAQEQITLFSPADPKLHELHSALIALDPDALSPREAWQWVLDWHERLRR